jgi:uncharacterized protein
MSRWLLALCLLGGLSAHAQSPVWALRGAHNTVYLAESVHLLKPGEAQLPLAFDRAYAAASTIVMELDLSHLDAAELQRYMLEHGTLAQGTTLAQAIGPDAYRRLSQQAEHLGLPLEPLEQLAPWVVALTVTEFEYMKLGYDADAGVERQIERRAERDSKPILGLETLQEQLGQLEHLSSAQQRRFLLLTLDDLDDAGRDTDELLAAWRKGDTRRLATLLGEEYRSFPELYRALVTERNQHWMPRIRSFLGERKDYLVIVGALHLVGDGGLLELARAAGINVTPVIARP